MSATSSKSINFYALTQHSRGAPTRYYVYLSDFRLKSDRKFCSPLSGFHRPRLSEKIVAGSVFINAFIFRSLSTSMHLRSNHVIPYFFIKMFKHPARKGEISSISIPICIVHRLSAMFPLRQSSSSPLVLFNFAYYNTGNNRCQGFFVKYLPNFLLSICQAYPTSDIPVRLIHIKLNKFMCRMTFLFWWQLAPIAVQCRKILFIFFRSVYRQSLKRIYSRFAIYIL